MGLMATAAPPREPPLDYESKSKSNGFDPDSYRMTVGEHLEELRWRMILALIGFAVVLGVCLFFGTEVLSAFCAPLVNTLAKYDINPQVVTDEVGEGFMTFIEISVISATALASPWILYQLWQFVAAGLYEHERKYVTRYLPLSITLLISGMLFVYFLVLPWTLEFFITFSQGVPLTLAKQTTPATQPTTQPLMQVPVINGVPARGWPDGTLAFDKMDGRLKLIINGVPRVIAINSNNLIAPEIKLSRYIDLVVGMLITFALAFQLPLVVLALERIGILEIETLQRGRRYVYFGMSILAAAITPGDVITATVALIFPLCALYELGIWLAKIGKKKEQRA
jgi:sec-independent protein translocase protein TatC